MVLLDANARRCEFLERAVIACGLEDRVSVVHQRAEVYGRSHEGRASFDGVVVRSFGPPAVVAECAAPLLHVGGWLIVSEPPVEIEPDEGAGNPKGEQSRSPEELLGGSTRWPADQLEQLGLQPIKTARAEFGYQVLRQFNLCPDRFPRRDGIPAKRPLF